MARGAGIRRYELDQVGSDFLDQAPARFVSSVVIDAPASAVWTALEDAATWSRWAKGIKFVEWTSEPPFGIGVTRTVTLVGNNTVFEEFFAWEPNRFMAFRINEATMSGISAWAERFELDPVPEDQTRFTWVNALRPRGASRIVIKLGMQLMMGRWLRGFKHVVEAASGDATSSGDQRGRA